jgi:hypothetical protein
VLGELEGVEVVGNVDGCWDGFTEGVIDGATV